MSESIVNYMKENEWWNFHNISSLFYVLDKSKWTNLNLCSRKKLDEDKSLKAATLTRAFRHTNLFVVFGNPFVLSRKRNALISLYSSLLKCLNTGPDISSFFCCFNIHNELENLSSCLFCLANPSTFSAARKTSRAEMKTMPCDESSF